jgi:hypothetical protein
MQNDFGPGGADVVIEIAGTAPAARTWSSR